MKQHFYTFKPFISIAYRHTNKSTSPVPFRSGECADRRTTNCKIFLNKINRQHKIWKFVLFPRICSCRLEGSGYQFRCVNIRSKWNERSVCVSSSLSTVKDASNSDYSIIIIMHTAIEKFNRIYVFKGAPGAGTKKSLEMSIFNQFN